MTQRTNILSRQRIHFIPNALPTMLANDAVVQPLAMLQKNCILIGKLSKNLKNSIYKRNFTELVKQNPKLSALTKYLYAKDTRTESWSAIWNDIRPIWFGGEDRSEESMNLFYQWLRTKTKHIRLAVMDMWKAFEKSTQQ